MHTHHAQKHTHLLPKAGRTAPQLQREGPKKQQTQISTVRKRHPSVKLYLEDSVMLLACSVHGTIQLRSKKKLRGRGSEEDLKLLF